MEPEAQIAAARPGFRYWKRVLISLLLLPFLGFVLSNLLLSSPWVRHWMAEKIERKTGLETTIGNVSWSPWAGLQINQLKLHQPAELRTTLPVPLASIATFQITPVWRAWLRGKFEVRSVSLDTPQLTLPLELLVHLAQAAHPAQPTPPQVAAATPAPPQVSQNLPPSPPPSPPPAVIRPSTPTGWIHLKNASLTLLSPTARQPIFAAKAISGSLPIAGDAAQSTLRIGGISCAGRSLAADFPAHFDWQPPFLTLRPLTFTIHEMKTTLALRLAMFSNFPLQISLAIPAQALPEMALPRDGKTHAESLAVNAAFRGLLLAPTTWQADCLVQALRPAVVFGPHEAKFDRGSAITVLRGGQLSCLDARLIGDELSILGNATLLANGSTAAACRLVSTPERLGGIVTAIFPNSSPPALTPLSTPQRAAFDLAAFGNFQHLYLQLGKDGPLLNLISPPAHP